MLNNPTGRNKRKKIWIALPAAIVLVAMVLSLPPVWSRVSYHSRVVYRTIKYWLKPPSEAVFIPSALEDGVLPTPTSAIVLSGSPTLQSTTEPTTIPPQSSTEATLLPTLTPLPTITPTTAPTSTPTSTPLPSSVLLTGMLPERQFMNNCGPATLSMYLSFYKWGKDQLATGGVIRPNDIDVNVMPYELADFVNQNTQLRGLWRYGADLQTIRAVLNIGLPVMIERGFEPYSLRNEGWVGHYNLVVGYDDERQTLTVHDSYLMSYPPWGAEIPVETWPTFIGFDFSYRELEQTWRSFNFVIIVVYPPEKENAVLTALGPLATEEGASRQAYERAMQETSSLTNVRDLYFAWYNAGTSLVALEDYSAAASAYDTAFKIYPDITLDSRPYRILWYEIGPYPAYYFTDRYQDVITLASQTLGNMAEPVLEESYYWRAMSFNALGEKSRAIEDLRTSLKYHPGYAPSLTLLDQLTANP